MELTGNKKVSCQQRKLLEAHYADSIALILFNEEQYRLSTAIYAIDQRI